MAQSTKSTSAKHLASSKKLLERFTAPRASIADRIDAGKRLRTTVPRESLAEFKLPAKRKDPVAILEGQAKTRLPELIPVRYARMLASPFAFLRGTAAVMAQDLSASAVTGLQVQACGDMHVSNFGVFASAERSYEFDPEVTPGKGIEAYCGLCGWALALAHAKSGDAAMISGYLGKTDEIDEALTNFAFAYSKQNERDHAELQKAERAHRIQVSHVS
jgi:hypothetical protein